MSQNVLMIGGVVHGKLEVAQTPLPLIINVVLPSKKWWEEPSTLKYDVYHRDFFVFGNNILAIYRHSEVSQQAATEMLFNLILNDIGKAVLLQ